MHPPIQEGLENHLAGRATAAGMDAFYAHLAACPECRQSVETVQGHSRMVRELRADVEPSPGFYARVMARIEQQRRESSFWSFFLQPIFARRLVFASLSLLVLLGVAAMSGDSSQPSMYPGDPVGILAASEPNDPSQFDAAQERDFVFTHLASYGSDGPALPSSSD